MKKLITIAAVCALSSCATYDWRDDMLQLEADNEAFHQQQFKRYSDAMTEAAAQKDYQRFLELEAGYNQATANWERSRDRLDAQWDKMERRETQFQQTTALQSIASELSYMNR